MKTNEQLSLIARNHNLDFLKSCSDYEQYATVYSKTMTELQRKEMNHSSDNQLIETKSNCVEDAVMQKGSKKDNNPFDTIDRYVKICYKGKTVYRKCSAKNGIKSTEIGLGDRTQKELGIDISTSAQVCVKASSFICYYLCNSDKHIKHTAMAGLIGIIFTILSCIISLSSLFVELPIFHCS